MVFEPVVPSSGLEAARRGFEATVAREVKLSRTSQLFTACWGAFGRVYYPVWVLRYLFKERSFQCGGGWVQRRDPFWKAPGNVLTRALTLVGGMALGLSCGGRFHLILSMADDDTAAFALGSLALAWELCTRPSEIPLRRTPRIHRYQELQSLPMINLDGDEDVVLQLVDK
jgi:hypothetical protein